MEYDQNIQYLSMAFWQIIMTAGPILVVALSVGLFIGLIQANLYKRDDFKLRSKTICGLICHGSDGNFYTNSND